MAERAFVFAPDPLLTVTVEAGGDGDEIHLHAGGQGFWVAQMIANLGVEVSLCGPFGGESGRVVRSLIDQDASIRVRAIETVGSNGVYVHDRREGDRIMVAETPPDPLGRHELDDLYGAALLGGLESSVAVTIQTASVDTRDEQRDGHLRSGDFFDTEAWPTMTYESRSVRQVGQGSYVVEGDLTIKGVTKPVPLELTYEGGAADPWGGVRIGFSAKAELDREAFGLTWNQALETGGVLVGKKVSIEIEAEAVKQS